jgi:hypothetical protein
MSSLIKIDIENVEKFKSLSLLYATAKPNKLIIPYQNQALCSYAALLREKHCSCRVTDMGEFGMSSYN